MRPFIHGDWHVWRATKGFLCSEESKKKLTAWPTTDDIVNLMWLANDKEAAKALHAHVKAEIEAGRVKRNEKGK